MRSLEDRLSLKDRHVLVTGASSGIGRHFAGHFARCGARVTAVARRTDRLTALAAELNGAGGRVRTGYCDTTDEVSMTRALDEAATAFGPVQVLVNNAGISVVKPALQMDSKSWRSVIDTNLNGVWIMAQLAAKALVAARQPGSIINIASVIGLRTFPGVAPYAASKLGVIALTRNLAVEWADHGIRVNAVVPGMFETELGGNYKNSNNERRQTMINQRVPMKRIGDHDELDGVMSLLASDAGSYMTGSVIAVDGGLTVNAVG